MLFRSDPIARQNDQVTTISMASIVRPSVLSLYSSLRSNISAKQQILATIDKATYLASRKDVQKANIERTIKELVREPSPARLSHTDLPRSRNNN